MQVRGVWGVGVRAVVSLSSWSATLKVFPGCACALFTCVLHMSLGTQRASGSPFVQPMRCCIWNGMRRRDMGVAGRSKPQQQAPAAAAFLCTMTGRCAGLHRWGLSLRWGSRGQLPRPTPHTQQQARRPCAGSHPTKLPVPAGAASLGAAVGSLGRSGDGGEPGSATGSGPGGAGGGGVGRSGSQGAQPMEGVEGGKQTRQSTSGGRGATSARSSKVSEGGGPWWVVLPRWHGPRGAVRTVG